MDEPADVPKAHRVKVRRMGSNILAIENGKPFVARPEGWDRKGLVNSIKRAFTLKYQMYNDREELIANVSFDSMKNYILIENGAGNIALDIPVFHLNAQKYFMNEKLTGMQVWPLWDSGDSGSGDVEVVIEARKSIMEYSIEMNCTDDNFEHVLKEFSVGLLIRWMSYLY